MSASVICNQELEDLDKWSCNIFRVAEFSNNRPLSCIMYAIFQVNVTAAVCVSWKFALAALGGYADDAVVLPLPSPFPAPSSTGARAIEDFSNSS